MRATIDGNEAAASVAYRLNEVCCIYPITPSSPMAELADEWSSRGGRTSGAPCPRWSRCRARAGPPARCTARCRAGALATTFTASQGLLLMIPNMYKIAGELTSAVHARRGPLAGGAGAVDLRRPLGRDGGAARPASRCWPRPRSRRPTTSRWSPRRRRSRTRVPFVHFFDGFRTSHELNTIEMLGDDDLRALVPEELIRDHRAPGAVARAPVHPRHRAEPGRLLPGARDGEPVLRAGARRGRGRHGAPRRAHRPGHAHRRVRGRSGGRSGARRDGLGRRDGGRDRRRPQRAGRAPRRGPATSVPPVPRGGAARRAARDRAAHRRARPHQGARLDGRAALPRRRRGPERGARRRRARGHAAGVRRALWPVVEGVHAGHGRGRVRRTGPRAAPAAVHHRHRRRRLRHEPGLRPRARHRIAGHGPRGLLRAGRRRDGRREQEHHQDPRLRGAPQRPGLLRLRLEEVGRADRLAPALRTAADPRALPRGAGELRRLPSVRPARPGRRPRERGDRRDAAAQLPPRSRHGVGRAVAPGPGPDPRQEPRRVRDRRRADRPRGRPRRTHQHRPADVLLRDLGRPAARRGDRADQGGDHEDLRQARRRGRAAKPRGGRPRRSRGCTRSPCPSAPRPCARCRRRCPPTRPRSSGPSPRR